MALRNFVVGNLGASLFMYSLMRADRGMLDVCRRMYICGDLGYCVWDKGILLSSDG